MQKEDYESFESAVDRSLDIIHYLNDTLDHQYEISNLSGPLIWSFSVMN